MHSKCDPGQGWSGFGTDPAVDMTVLYDAYGRHGVVQQRFKGSPSFRAGGPELMYMQSKIAKAGRLTASELKACCFPASEGARDCSRALQLIEEFKVEEGAYKVGSA